MEVHKGDLGYEAKAWSYYIKAMEPSLNSSNDASSEWLDIRKEDSPGRGLLCPFRCYIFCNVVSNKQ